MDVKTEKKNIDLFLESLRERLHKKADEGFSGWDRGSHGLGNDNGRLPSTASNSDLRARLDYAISKEKYIDAAAFASMLWRRQVDEAQQLSALAEKI